MQSRLVRFPLLLLACCILLDAARAEEPKISTDEGNWGLGRRLFHSAELGCFKCHMLDGSGGSAGPDLSKLKDQDASSVLHAITNPSAEVAPPYAGQQTQMPDRLLDSLNESQVADLLAYLLKSAPQMPLDSPLQAPPLRTMEEVKHALSGSNDAAEPTRQLNIVLVAGKKDHGPGEHDYPAWQVQWGQLLAAAEHVEISMAWDFPDAGQLENADVLIFFQKGTWNDQRQEQLDQYLSRGGGAVYVHWAVNGDQRVGDFSKRIGLASKAGGIRYRHGPLTLDIHNTEHPIVRNFDRVQLYDESYWELTGNPQNITLLASSLEEGQSTPQIWTYEAGKGKVFVSIPGHYSWTFDDPLFRILLLRGIAWTANESVDRFNELVTLGARISRQK